MESILTTALSVSYSSGGIVCRSFPLFFMSISLLALSVLMIIKTVRIVGDEEFIYGKGHGMDISVELVSHTCSAMFLTVMLFSFCLMLWSDRPESIAVALFALYVPLYVYLYYRHIVNCGAGVAKGLRSRMSDNIRMLMSVKSDKTIRLSYRMLYKRIVEYMDENKPYLSPMFGLEDMAKAMYTNSGYVSRTINACSGTNFSQFVNRYRVLYAITLFKSDTNLKVMELCQLSGFNTKVTFNMAFKMIMHTTPGEWCRNYLESMPLDSDPSKRQG